MPNLEKVTRSDALACGLTRYFTGKPCPHGHVAELSAKNSTCVVCRSIGARKWELDNPDKARAKGKRYHARHRATYNAKKRKALRDVRRILSSNPYTLKNSFAIVKRIITGIKRRARDREIAFSMTPEDLLPLPTHCPILGLELVYLAQLDSKGHRLPNLASVDRLYSEKGYVSGNVGIVSYRGNMLKNNASVEELRNIITYLEINGVNDDQK